MRNPAIDTLNKTREELHKSYRETVIKRNNVMDTYSKQMTEIGAQIQEIDMEIRRLRTPVYAEEP
jgi:prefoldin subunit 5